MQGGLRVVQFAVTARQTKPIRRVQKASLADLIQRLVIGEYGNIHRSIQFVSAVFEFLPHAVALPTVPIGNVRKFRFARSRVQPAVFVHFIGFAAGVAGKCSAFALGFALCIAMRATVQNAL